MRYVACCSLISKSSVHTVQSCRRPRRFINTKKLTCENLSSLIASCLLRTGLVQKENCKNACWKMILTHLRESNSEVIFLLSSTSPRINKVSLGLPLPLSNVNLAGGHLQEKTAHDSKMISDDVQTALPRTTKV